MDEITRATAQTEHKKRFLHKQGQQITKERAGMKKKIFKGITIAAIVVVAFSIMAIDEAETFIPAITGIVAGLFLLFAAGRSQNEGI